MDYESMADHDGSQRTLDNGVNIYSSTFHGVHFARKTALPNMVIVRSDSQDIWIMVFCVYVRAERRSSTEPSISSARKNFGSIMMTLSLSTTRTIMTPHL